MKLKIKDIDQIVQKLVSEEIKKSVLNENSGKEVYHIKADGVPLATYETEQEANEYLPKYKNEHPGKELIIEPGDYQSYDEMIDKFDEMSEEIDETEEECSECGDQEFSEEETTEGIDFEKILRSPRSGKKVSNDVGLEEAKQTCSECGGELNEEGVCAECSGSQINERKKIRLKESELIEMIKKMVIEAIPGIEVTKNAQKGSKKDNDSYMSDVEKKIKQYLSFDGNDNPEFPKQIGKGEKVARQNSKEEDETVSDYRGGGMEDFDYDVEPSDTFKERAEKALTGDPKMGNSQDAANVIKTDTGKKIVDKVKRKKEKEKKEFNVSWGHAWKEPEKVKQVNENKIPQEVNDEIQKIKKLTTYNKKTQ
jgi:hypothetical protein